MLRLLLPPNLTAAIPRDAVAVRVELDLAVAPPAELLPGLAVLQRLGVKPEPVSLVQLTRAQLRELISALAGQPVFFHGSTPEVPLAWHGRELSGVSELLDKNIGPIIPVGPIKNPRPPARPAPAPPTPDAPPAPLLIDGSEHFLAITLPAKESAHYDAVL